MLPYFWDAIYWPGKLDWLASKAPRICSSVSLAQGLQRSVYTTLSGFYVGPGHWTQDPVLARDTFCTEPVPHCTPCFSIFFLLHGCVGQKVKLIRFPVCRFPVRFYIEFEKEILIIWFWSKRIPRSCFELCLPFCFNLREMKFYVF